MTRKLSGTLPAIVAGIIAALVAGSALVVALVVVGTLAVTWYLGRKEWT